MRKKRFKPWNRVVVCQPVCHDVRWSVILPWRQHICVRPFLPPAACHCQFPREAGRWLIGSCAVHALTALNRPTKEDRPCSHHLEKNRIGIVTKGNAHGRSMLLPSDGRFSEATVPLAKSGPPLLLSARCCRQTLRRRGHFLRVPDYLPFQNER